jgi:hypothetical protein
MPPAVPTDTIEELKVARRQLLQNVNSPGFTEKLKALNDTIAGREALASNAATVAQTDKQIAELEAIRARMARPGTNPAMWTASSYKNDLDNLYAARARLMAQVKK